MSVVLNKTQLPMLFAGKEHNFPCFFLNKTQLRMLFAEQNTTYHAFKFP